MKLFEIFDRPLPFTMRREGLATYRYTFSDRVPMEILDPEDNPYQGSIEVEYVVSFYLNDDYTKRGGMSGDESEAQELLLNAEWWCDMAMKRLDDADPEYRMDATGLFNSIPVISTVVDIFMDFLRREPEAVVGIAGNTPKKTQMYKAVVGFVKKRMNNRVDILVDNDSGMVLDFSMKERKRKQKREKDETE